MKKEDIIQVIESTAISVAASFPVLSSFASGWTEYKNFIQKRNIEDILRNFYNHIKELQTRVDNNYIKSEEFKSLIVKTCFLGEEESSEEKRKYLSNFLVNACKEENSKDTIKFIILETLSKLTAFDIQILNYVNQHSESNWTKMENYNPAEIEIWSCIWETEVIKEFKNIEELEIITTLEYLNVIGVIDNISSRSFNPHLDKEIEEHRLRHEMNNLYSELIPLFEKKDTKSKERAQEIEKDLEKLSKELKEVLDDDFNKLQNQKFYSISSLGRNILSYLNL